MKSVVNTVHTEKERDTFDIDLCIAVLSASSSLNEQRLKPLQTTQSHLR
jgi:hypothetical protein